MAAEKGFDPMELPPDRFFSWLWFVFTKNMDEKERLKFEIDINRPVVGVEPTSGVWSDEAMSAAFMSAQTKLKG